MGFCLSKAARVEKLTGSRPQQCNDCLNKCLTMHLAGASAHAKLAWLSNCRLSNPQRRVEERFAWICLG